MDLISGATGFIGQRLFHALQADGLQCRRLVRKQLPGADSHTADLADKTALTAACSGIEKVFHCAGYAHAFSSDSGNDLEKQWQVNFEGTRNLVEAAGQAGVRRFLFLSSVKAMARPGNVCIDEDFSGEPETAYAVLARKRVACLTPLRLRQPFLQLLRPPFVTESRENNSDIKKSDL